MVSIYYTIWGFYPKIYGVFTPFPFRTPPYRRSLAGAFEGSNNNAVVLLFFPQNGNFKSFSTGNCKWDAVAFTPNGSSLLVELWGRDARALTRGSVEGRVFALHCKVRGGVGAGFFFSFVRFIFCEFCLFFIFCFCFFGFFLAVGGCFRRVFNAIEIRESNFILL